MRNMRRNKVTVYYAPLVGLTPVDEGSVDTLEHDHAYGEKVEIEACVSPATVNVSGEWYGVAERYDKTLIIEGVCPFDESAGLWIDDLQSTDPDYEVKRIAQSATIARVYAKKLV